MSAYAGGQQLAITRGDDYRAADGRALAFTNTAWPDLTSGSVSLELRKTDDQTTVNQAGVVASADSVTVELTATWTAALELGLYRYALKASLASTHEVTLATGMVVVTDQP